MKYHREKDRLNRLHQELAEKGTARDKILLDLYQVVRKEPAGLPIVVRFRHLSLEEFHQFRSKVEPMSEEELAEEKRKADEEFKRKQEEFLRPLKNNPPITIFP
jgi:hypothetical protein